jgi:toxin ParE1/3/4
MSETNRRVYRSPEAQEDLLDIWHFGANAWSPEQADRHLRDIDVMCDRLREDPKLGHRRDDLIPGLRSMYVRPHFVFYRISAGTVTIVRVLHERFDLPMRFRQ